MINAVEGNFAQNYKMIGSCNSVYKSSYKMFPDNDFLKEGKQIF